MSIMCGSMPPSNQIENVFFDRNDDNSIIFISNIITEYLQKLKTVKKLFVLFKFKINLFNRLANEFVRIECL